MSRRNHRRNSSDQRWIPSLSASKMAGFCRSHASHGGEWHAMATRHVPVAATRTHQAGQSRTMHPSHHHSSSVAFLSPLQVATPRPSILWRLAAGDPLHASPVQLGRRKRTGGSGQWQCAVLVAWAALCAVRCACSWRSRPRFAAQIVCAWKAVLE